MFVQYSALVCNSLSILSERNTKKSKVLIRNPRFRMAYDFLVLRSESIDKDLKAIAEYWTNIQK